MTRRSCCGRRQRPPREASGWPARPSTVSPRTSTRMTGGSAGPTARSPSSWRCCARVTGRSTSSRRSTSEGCSSSCCRSGTRCAADRSATPTTATRSTGTCGRRPPTPPRSTDRVGRPDLLVLGALFHDLGKGYPGDHTAAGMELMGAIGPRLGLPPDDVATLVRLIAAPPPAAGDGGADATSPIRPRSDSWRTPSATRTPSSCCTRSPRPTRWRPGRRRGARGRRSWSPNSSRGPVSCSSGGRRTAPPMMTASPPTGVCPTKPRSPRWPPGDSTSASRATVTCA